MRFAPVLGAWLACAALGSPAAHAKDIGEPTVVFFNGRIHTQNAGREVVSALALVGNRVMAVGSDATIARLAGKNTRRIDLAGRVVLPGIIDAHTHPAMSAQMADKCNLNDQALAFPQIKQRIQECLKRLRAIRNAGTKS